MINTEHIEQAGERIRENLSALRKLPGGRKYEALLTALELDLAAWQEGFMEKLSRLEDSMADERDRFDLHPDPGGRFPELQRCTASASKLPGCQRVLCLSEL